MINSNFLVDVYDGGDTGPKIFHSKTLTSKLLFEDALIAIKEYAFKLTEYVANFFFIFFPYNIVMNVLYDLVYR